MSDLEIYPLYQKPKFAQTCAAWGFGEWGAHMTNSSLEDNVAAYKKRTVESNNIPLTWIGTINEKIVGMISLDEHDHDDHKDLSPWLASMYIHPTFRKNGYATQLIQHLHTEAKKLGYNHLYLFTPDAMKLYEKNGWKITGKVRDPRGIYDHEKLMEIEL